jgi:deoxyribonuclease IV
LIRFHSPGMPVVARKAGTLGSLPIIKELGLDGLEVEFTHGVNMKDEVAAEIKKKAEELDLTLTVHGPFWINLYAKEIPKRYAGMNYILQSVKKAHLMGAKSVTFHPAFMQGNPEDEVIEGVKDMLEKLLAEMDKLEIHDVQVAPELTGKESQFGSVDQLIKLDQAIKDPRITLCIDFTHNFARTVGKYNGREAFQEVLDKIKKGLGANYLKNLHMHFGGMVYGPKGEKKHRTLPEEDEFEWQTLVKVLKENNVSGWATIETPDIEVSTKVAKDYYESL